MRRWWVASLLVACGLPEEGQLATSIDSGADVATTDVTVPDVVVDDTSPPLDDAPIVDAPPDAPVAISAAWALQFTGGSFVDMGHIPIPNDFTLEAWINPKTASSETCVVAEDKRNQSEGQFRLGLANGGKVFFVMSDGTGSSHGLFGANYALQSPSPITLGVWTHVAVVKNGATFVLAINGAPSANFTADAPFVQGGQPVSFRVASRVDTNGSAPDNAFDGIIDEVRLWSSPRSLAQITQAMGTEIPASSAGLFAYWRFDEGTALAASDDKTGYPGTLVNNPTWIKSTAF